MQHPHQRPLQGHAQRTVDLQVQDDQLNMAVCFWFLVKSDLSSVITFYKVPEKQGNVYLVGLYLNSTFMYNVLYIHLHICTLYIVHMLMLIL